MRRLTRSPLAALSPEQRAQLIAVQVDASRPAYSGVLLGGACLVLILALCEGLGWVPRIGYPLPVMAGGGVLMVALAVAALRVEQLGPRWLMVSIYGLGLAALISMPIDGETNQLLLRTGLFNLVPIAALALTVRSSSAIGLVSVFILVGAARIWIYGVPVTGGAMYWLFTCTSVAFGLMLRSYRMSFAVHAFTASHALWRQASTDELTGLLNRTGWNAAAIELVARAGERGQQLSAVFFDIDRFKRVNDTHGHAIGDEILRHLGGVITHQLPRDSVAARFGGEEFVALLATGDSDDAVEYAHDVRRAFAAAVATYRCGVSAGIAHQHPGETLSELLKRADRGLYAAKAEGRDRVSVTA
ncbi:GGDEF domain-containing protein [Lysobacter sp. D1-1-M9]|uniref:GGDEF domain-containing protein n=1 Tax=Novilysobacter longmucuonensis TaxID=3098603 RepID=UPI002FC87E14